MSNPNTGAAIAHIWPGLFQQAFVVADLDHAMKTFTEQLGVPRWLVMPDTPSTLQTPTGTVEVGWHLAFGYCGDTQIELIEPVSGPSHHAGFLAERGGGPHHLGYLVTDPAIADAAADAFEAAGVACLFRIDMPDGMIVRYFDTSPLLTEVILDGPEASFSAMCSALHDGLIP